MVGIVIGFSVFIILMAVLIGAIVALQRNKDDGIEEEQENVIVEPEAPKQDRNPNISPEEQAYIDQRMREIKAKEEEEARARAEKAKQEHAAQVLMDTVEQAYQPPAPPTAEEIQLKKNQEKINMQKELKAQHDKKLEATNFLRNAKREAFLEDGIPIEISMKTFTMLMLADSQGFNYYTFDIAIRGNELVDTRRLKIHRFSETTTPDEFEWIDLITYGKKSTKFVDLMGDTMPKKEELAAWTTAFIHVYDASFEEVIDVIRDSYIGDRPHLTSIDALRAFERATFKKNRMSEGRDLDKLRGAVRGRINEWQVELENSDGYVQGVEEVVIQPVSEGPIEQEPVETPIPTVVDNASQAPLEEYHAEVTLPTEVTQAPIPASQQIFAPSQNGGAEEDDDDYFADLQAIMDHRDQ